MSLNKKSVSSSESSRVAPVTEKVAKSNVSNESTADRAENSTASQNADTIVKKHSAVSAGTKRAVRELTEPKDWTPLMNRVFITKGEGDLRENVVIKGGAQKSVFSIIGVCFDGRVLVLQVWGVHAKKMSDLFKRMALPDLEPTLWVVPVAPSKGLFFREMKANDYQVRAYGASFTLVLEYGLKESEPRADLTKEAYPSMFDWADGNFTTTKGRIPHYSMWGQDPASSAEDKTHALDDYSPPIRTYEDASPAKAPRVTVLPSSSTGNTHRPGMTDLTFETDE